MSKRFHALAITAALAATMAWGLSALAQAPNPETPPPDANPPVPGPETPLPNPDAPLKPPEPSPEVHQQLPRGHAGPVLGIDKLFEALKVAPTNDSAKFVENRIWAMWLAAGGDTGTLLMGRVKTAMDGKDYDLAIKLLNAIIDIRPGYVEAWNRRATIYFIKKDFAHSMEDLSEVLAREPRHFGALSGLGMILQEIGDDKHALDAFRRALAVHPRLEKIPDVVKRLTEKVEGRGI
jgi:tetratricopeptide (TPR) repeat protein